MSTHCERNKVIWYLSMGGLECEYHLRGALNPLNELMWAIQISQLDKDQLETDSLYKKKDSLSTCILMSRGITACYMC